MALDPKVKQLLNDFAKSQPALNLEGEPANESGILLGDLIDAGGNPVAAAVAALASSTSANLAGADSVDQAALEAEISDLKAKVNAILAALKAAGIMAS